MLGTATGQEVELHPGLRYWPWGKLNTNQICQAAENYRIISQCLKEKKKEKDCPVWPLPTWATLVRVSISL